MSGYSIRFVAHCCEGTSDKVWGYIQFNSQPGTVGSLYSFWGARGKTYSFKRYYGWDGVSELEQLASRKIRPRSGKAPYVPVDSARLDELCPGFKEEFDKQLTMAKFSGKVRSDFQEDQTFI